MLRLAARVASLALLLPPVLRALRLSDHLKHALEAHLDSVTESGFGSLTESEVVGSARVRHLSADEYRERLTRPGLSPAEAEQVFHEKLLRAISLAQARAKVESPTNASEAPQMDIDRGEEYAFWAGQDPDAVAAMEASSFEREQFKKLLASVQPNVHVYMCLQMNVDLSMVPPYIPALRMSVGLLGGLYVDPTTGCWGGELELSLGFDWGVKVLGFTMGVGVSATGPLDFAEVPPERAIGDGLAQQRGFIYAPQGADLSQCHSRSPWPVLKAYWEEQVMKALTSREVRKKMQSEAERHQERVEEFRQIYSFILSGLSKPVETEASDALEAPRLVAPASAMLVAARRFAGMVPIYATQVMTRLTDNSNTRKGADNERERLWASVWRRFRNSNGRFLARWPSSEALSALEEKAGGDVDLEDEISGVTRRKLGTDMRVINFAKVMRLSKHRGELSFWKELAMSASNLMMRVVGDVKALYATFLAGDPHWDGSCEALPAVFNSTSVNEDVLRNMEAYAWASKSTRKEERASFAQGPRKASRLPLEQWEGQHPDANRPLALFPHLWCGLAEQTSEGPEHAMIERLLNGREVLEVSVSQACDTVVREIRDLDLDGGDEVYKDDVTGRPMVRRGGRTVGALDGEMDPDSDWSRDLSKYKVVTKVVESRPECERARLPASFVRLFPQFAHAAAEWAAQLEALLLDINACLDEMLDYEGIADSLARSMEHRQGGAAETSRHACANSNKDAKLAHVQSRAIDIVRIVRYALLQLGAEDPRKAQYYREGEVGVDEAEGELMELINGGLAPVAQSLVDDFSAALGLRVEEARYGHSLLGKQVQLPTGAFGTVDAVSGRGRSVVVDGKELELVSRKDVQSLLVVHFRGHLWLGAPELLQQLLQQPDPLRRLTHDTQRLKPLVEFTDALSFTAQVSQNNFCTANSGPLMVSWVKHRSWQTWSSKISEERCWVGRARPGSFFVQIMRCSGSSSGEGGKSDDFVDWRVRFQATVVRRNPLGFGGIIADLLQHSYATLEATLITAGALLGAAGSHSMVEKLYPHVFGSSALSALLLTGASSLPLLGAVGAPAMLVAKSSFRDVCSRFLSNLAQQGVLEASRIPAGVVEAPGSHAEGPGWGYNAMLLVWGAVVHRQQAVHLISGPPALGEMEPDAPRMLYKFQRFVSVHLENWNRISTPQLGVLTTWAEVHAKLELDWDITPWVERRMNRKLFLQNRERVHACTACSNEQKAFCDWRVPLGTLWEPEHDVCVSDTAEERQRCTRENGVVDELGHPVRAVFYSAQDAGGSAACRGIPWTMTNREFRLNDKLRRYLRRK